MTRALTPAGVIHAVAGQEPERALIAAVVHQAAVDARAGDGEARAWLGSEACARWLGWIAPDHADPAVVQGQLVADVDAALARRPPTRIVGACHHHHCPHGEPAAGTRGDGAERIGHDGTPQG